MLPSSNRVVIMPFGPAIAVFVIIVLYIRQSLKEKDNQRKIDAKKQKEQAKEQEQTAELLARVVKYYKEQSIEKGKF